MTFWIYKKNVIHYCQGLKLYRSLYNKNLMCSSCKIKVPFILSAGSSTTDIDEDNIYIGSRFTATEDLPNGAIKIEL